MFICLELLIEAPRNSDYLFPFIFFLLPDLPPGRLSCLEPRESWR